ncbi:MAG TPA: Ldh family oxidoreductase [Ktedonobacterales bacterium]|nr:Ldh family oxidoreductase [Ktedonobacterales bacterium]
MPRAREAALREFARRILLANGMAPEEAATIADCLVQANLRGVDSHGALRLIQYTDAVCAGRINVRPEVAVVRRRGAMALLNADNGYGFTPTLRAVELGVELAAEHGIGMVAVRQSHHFGMAATYVLKVAERDYIGLLMTTSLPVLPPPGGLAPRLGNNPIACGIPRRPPHPPIALDMALSQVAFGKVRLAAAEGRPIPLGWANDERGQPTTDSAAALRAGLLAPVGGYKGYGLAMMTEVIAGILPGAMFGLRSDAHGDRAGSVGHTLIVIDPTCFVEREQFYDDLEQLIAEVKSTPLGEGAPPVYLPGEVERATLEERQVHGIPLSGELTAQLQALAARLGVEPLEVESADDAAEA